MGAAKISLDSSSLTSLNQSREQIPNPRHRRRATSGGQSEPAPTSAPMWMWMDGAPMVAPFSSLPYPLANQGGKLKLTFSFFFHSSAQVSFLLLGFRVLGFFSPPLFF
jgi:hypothetical protein